MLTVDILDEKYTSGLFSSRDSYAFDVQNDGHATGAINVFQYLQNLNTKKIKHVNYRLF